MWYKRLPRELGRSVDLPWYSSAEAMVKSAIIGGQKSIAIIIHTCRISNHNASHYTACVNFVRETNMLQKSISNDNKTQYLRKYI